MLRQQCRKQIGGHLLHAEQKIPLASYADNEIKTSEAWCVKLVHSHRYYQRSNIIRCQNCQRSVL